jgi:hypothetical protein
VPFGSHWGELDQESYLFGSNLMQLDSKLMEFGSKLMEFGSKLMEFTLRFVTNNKYKYKRLFSHEAKRRVFDSNLKQ